MRTAASLTVFAAGVAMVGVGLLSLLGARRWVRLGPRPPGRAMGTMIPTGLALMLVAVAFIRES